VCAGHGPFENTGLPFRRCPAPEEIASHPVAEATRLAANRALRAAAERVEASRGKLQRGHFELMEELQATFAIALEIQARSEASPFAATPPFALEALMTQLLLVAKATGALGRAFDELHTVAKLSAVPMELEGRFIEGEVRGVLRFGGFLGSARNFPPTAAGCFCFPAGGFGGVGASARAQLHALVRHPLICDGGHAELLVAGPERERYEGQRRLLRSGIPISWYLALYRKECNRTSPWRWVADEEACACKRCAREFNLVRRKHHCRLCGHIFCDDCSPRRYARPLPRSLSCLQGHAVCVLVRHGAYTARGADLPISAPCPAALRGLASISLRPSAAPGHTLPRSDTRAHRSAAIRQRAAPVPHPPTLPLLPPKPPRALPPLRLAVRSVRRSYRLGSMAPDASVRSCMDCLEKFVKRVGPEALFMPDPPSNNPLFALFCSG
jgi:hypothetical protein